jgi:hypothetical protein
VLSTLGLEGKANLPKPTESLALPTPDSKLKVSVVFVKIPLNFKETFYWEGGGQANIKVRIYNPEPDPG